MARRKKKLIIGAALWIILLLPFILPALAKKDTSNSWILVCGAMVAVLWGYLYAATRNWVWCPKWLGRFVGDVWDDKPHGHKLPS